jgi:hypothetical protein
MRAKEQGVKMKGIQLVGLCIIAAFALSAIGATSASAAVEFGTCLELNKNTLPKVKKGKYEPGCQTLFKKKGTPAAKGSFEWINGMPNCFEVKKKGAYDDPGCTALDAKHKGQFEKRACAPNCNKLNTHGGIAFLETENAVVSEITRIECKTNSSEGAEIAEHANEGFGRAVYTGCKNVKAGAGCTSSGANTEEIRTEPLEGTPQEIGGKVWIHYTSSVTVGSVEHVLAVFQCGSAGEFRVHGFADGIVGGEPQGGVNALASVTEQSFSKALGHQELFLEVKTGAGGFGVPEKSNQNQTTVFETYGPATGYICDSGLNPEACA